MCLPLTEWYECPDGQDLDRLCGDAAKYFGEMELKTAMCGVAALTSYLDLLNDEANHGRFTCVPGGFADDVAFGARGGLAELFFPWRREGRFPPPLWSALPRNTPLSAAKLFELRISTFDLDRFMRLDAAAVKVGPRLDLNVILSMFRCAPPHPVRSPFFLPPLLTNYSAALWAGTQCFPGGTRRGEEHVALWPPERVPDRPGIARTDPMAQAAAQGRLVVGARAHDWGWCGDVIDWLVPIILQCDVLERAILTGSAHVDRRPLGSVFAFLPAFAAISHSLVEGMLPAIGCYLPLPLLGHPLIHSMTAHSPPPSPCSFCLRHAGR